MNKFEQNLRFAEALEGAAKGIHDRIESCDRMIDYYFKQKEEKPDDSNYEDWIQQYELEKQLSRELLQYLEDKYVHC